ncbi:hypothetical protein NLU13_5837 [Sarocladium strictum]|uniref:DUF7735 domain-containing protein n=1 Tax=Sarocladium strictum TaxID=5046 RepID=A0AA39L6Q3_SARSR|nr:hypothetical protein NLU13_5837 [Sarocladium strictum]
MQTAFILASLAGSALAGHVLNAAPILKRDLEALQPRQTDSAGGSSNIEACQSAALDLLTSLPTPPPEIQSDAVNNAQTGDPCSFSTPSSLSAEYSSYSEKLMSWYSGHEDSIKSVADKCSDLASLGGDLLDVCSTQLPDGLGGSAATKTTDGDSKETKASGASTQETSSSGSGSSSASASQANNTQTSTGGAARATGMAVAGLAAGIMAAVL